MSARKSSPNKHRSAKRRPSQEPNAAKVSRREAEPRPTKGQKDLVPEPPDGESATEDVSLREAAGVGDVAVRARTGKSWKQWFAALDRNRSEEKSHQDVARWLRERHGLSGWWSQMVTVAYEQERGLRDRYQAQDGRYQAGGSKTVGVPVARLYAAWKTAAARRRWLKDSAFVIRKATDQKSLRITWIDGVTHVDVSFFEKGEGRSQVSVQHKKLKSEAEVIRQKAYWKENLARLQEHLEATS